MATITAREFFTESFNLSFLSDEEKETIFMGAELYAKGKCKEQRKICYEAWAGMPQWKEDSVSEIRERGQRTILNAAEPKFDLKETANP